MCHVEPVWSVARKLGQALVAASKPSQRWSSAIEETLRRLVITSPVPFSPALVSSIIDPYLLQHHSLAAGIFHFASHQPNFSHSPLSFHSYLKSLSISRHPHSIISLLKLAQSQRIRLLPSSIALAASSLLRIGRPVEASEILRHADDELPPVLCNSILAVLSSNGFLSAAIQLFDEMLIRKVEFNTVGFACFIGKLSKVEELENTLLLVNKVKQQQNCKIDGSIIAAIVVDNLCRAFRIDDSWRVLEELRKRDCKPDFISYRIVSEGYKSACRFEEMGRILKQKRKLGVAPRANDYKDFIFSLISERRTLEAKELGEAIVNGDFPIEDDVLNALIESVSTIDSDSAITFCKHLIEKGGVLSPLVLKNMSKNLYQDGKSDAMWDMFKLLHEKSYFKGLEQYNAMLSFLCKAGRVKEAYDMLNSMRDTGVTPDILSYNLLMDALCREDMLRPAKKLWDELFVYKCCANLCTYNILIKKFAQVGEATEALGLFDHMLGKGIVPNDVVYSSIMKVLCDENRMSEALALFCRCLEQDDEVASSTLRDLVVSFCSEGNYKCASQIMQGVPAKLESYESDIILLKTLANAGEMDLAAKHLVWVRNTFPSKLQMISTHLHQSLSTAPKLDNALELLRAVKLEALTSDDGSRREFSEGGAVVNV